MQTTFTSVPGYLVLNLVLVASTCCFAPGCGGGTDGVPTASIPTAGESAGGTSATAHHRDDEPVALMPYGQGYGQEFQSPAQSQEEFYPEVLIQTNLGSVRLKLDGEKSPRTVANFLYNYVEAGFYDQTVFHYVENGYMIAGGGYTVALEEKQAQLPIPSEANNGLSNKRGTIAMARHPGFANSATSQFYINVVDNPQLDCRPGGDDQVNGYCVFGEVLEGMDVVNKIAQLPVHDQGEFMNTPVEPVIVETVSRIK